VVFSGGADVDPKRYGEEAKDTCAKIQYLRDELEFTALKIALEKNKPILAICRGSQLLNAFLGGTLYQDIPTERPSEISHKQDEPYSSPSHLIKINENTPLGALIGANTMLGNSMHHQAIKKLASGLEVMAVADDGLIEATYLPGYRYLRAYQWHPERLVEVNEHNKMIIEDFIAACRER
jgi:putative glutamine amidotransferase